MQLTYAPDEPRLFLLGEKPEDPQIEPHTGIKKAQGMVSSSSISVEQPDHLRVHRWSLQGRYGPLQPGIGNFCKQ